MPEMETIEKARRAKGEGVGGQARWWLRSAKWNGRDPGSVAVGDISRYGEPMQVKELGHVVLYVSDLARSRAFYRDVLGWTEITPEQGLSFPAAAFSSGRTHHELLLIEVGPGAAPIPRGRRLGMYHFGLKVGESDDELREARDQLNAAGARIVGATDHGVTHSLYIQDPDGNEIELYIDVQPEVWRKDPAAVLTSEMRPLRL